MNDSKIEDIARIKNMITNIDFCCKYIDNVTWFNFNNDMLLQYALCMSLQIICENANHISNETKNIDETIPWNDIKTTRNIISHEYGALNILSIYDTIKNDLPNLKIKLIQLLDKI